MLKQNARHFSCPFILKDEKVRIVAETGGLTGVGFYKKKLFFQPFF
jgi:hypothetical protein